MRPIKEQLEQKLPWLFSEFGFRIVSGSLDASQYDSSVAVLECPAFRMKFSWKMGLVEVYVAAISEPERWNDFGFLWEAIYKERPEPTLEGYGPLLRRGFVDLTAGLGPKLPQTGDAMERLARERQKVLTDCYSRRAASRGLPVQGVWKTAIRRLLTALFDG